MRTEFYNAETSQDISQEITAWSSMISIDSDQKHFMLFPTLLQNNLRTTTLVLMFLSQSPHLNPTESVWVGKKVCASKDAYKLATKMLA